MAPPKKAALSRLLKLDGAIQADNRKNIHSEVISTRSPAFNFIFGNGQGLPKGYSLLLYGPPRGGKSILLNEMIGWLHQSDPEAVAIKFNTEFREKAQLDDDLMKMYGIDPDRLISYEVNAPNQIFDRIEKEIAAEIQDGLKVGLIGIDSINGVQGRRSLNAESVDVQQIGDHALTIQTGLQRILPCQRKGNYGLVLTSHIRAEMDMAKQMRGQKVRPAVSYGLQHHCEYYVYVEPLLSKEGKTDLLGAKFVDESVTDFRDNGEITGHKVVAKMMDSSMGPKGRVGMFTFDYKKGIINQHEEVFTLGVNRGVIDKPNNLSYAFGSEKWTGKPAMLEALKSNPQLCDAILHKLNAMDLAGQIKPLEEEITE